MMNAGTILMFAGSQAPIGFLMCDGSAVSRDTYSALFAVIGTTYGTGDGSTTFNLPNLSGKVAIGSSNSHALGSTGGEENHTLSIGETPAHTHTIPKHGHANTVKATTPALSHTITQPAFTYNAPGETKNSGYFTKSVYTGTTTTNATRSANLAISDHAAAACTKTGSITDRDAFNTQSNGSGSSHSNMQPFITLNYVISTGD